MNNVPSSPAYLARLLDRLGTMYPHGIPLSAIRHDSKIDESGNNATDFSIFVLADSSPMSQDARTLLDGILTKGLRLSEGRYSLIYGDHEAIQSSIAGSQSKHLIVFGLAEGTRSEVLGNDRTIIYTDSLDVLVKDSASKRGLWRALQGLNL